METIRRAIHVCVGAALVIAASGCASSKTGGPAACDWDPAWDAKPINQDAASAVAASPVQAEAKDGKVFVGVRPFQVLRDGVGSSVRTVGATVQRHPWATLTGTALGAWAIFGDPIEDVSGLFGGGNEKPKPAGASGTATLGADGSAVLTFDNVTDAVTVARDRKASALGSSETIRINFEQAETKP